ncbi:MAG: SWIM zinc finger family protein, partial [Burkholderiaceae bacterium]|nr:SWIM zinc finger family protein [Burkholderiaceae bacterium]
MLNRELDPAVLERAKALGIAVFPEHWRDLGMRCSCPDYAVPCKHLAAVVYLVSREIDGNPFMVFALKGVDLAKALKERDISIEREARAALPTLAALLLPAAESASGAEAERASATKPKSRSKSKCAVAAAEAAPAVAPVPLAAANADAAPLCDYAAPDYSTLPELGALLVGVLPAKPAFFQHGDFRASYDKVMTRVAKWARRGLETTWPGQVAAFRPDDKAHIVLDEQYRPTLTGMAHDTRLRVLMHMLEHVAEADLPELQPEVAALYHARVASLHLLARGAVLPQVFDCGKDGVAVRWLPAL